MMNQTYLIEEIECKKSNDKFAELGSKRDEIKLRLGQMRQRARIMLDKHNWQKFFSENGNLINSIESQNQTSSTVYTETSEYVSTLNIFSKTPMSNESDASKLNLFNSSQSAINNLDYDSLLLSNQTECSKFQIKLMPLLNATESSMLNLQILLNIFKL